MKKSLILGMLLCASTAMAGNIITLTTSPYSAKNAGEFTILPSFGVGAYSPLTKNITLDGTFQTFCAEPTEAIFFGNTFEVAPNDTTSLSGKVLTKGAAYLYEQFAKGTLTGYSYAPAGRLASAEKLQNDLWALMQFPGYTLSAMWKTELEQKVGDYLAANDGQYPVQLLNVYTLGFLGNELPDNNRQDIFVLVGVPDGGLTVSLLGMALASLGVASRRFRK